MHVMISVEKKSSVTIAKPVTNSGTVATIVAIEYLV